MELIKRLVKAIADTDMRTVESYYDGSFGGVRFERVGEEEEPGVYRDVEYKGYMVSDGFDVGDFTVHVAVREENPKIVQIYMGAEIEGLEEYLADEETGLPVLGSFIYGDGDDLSLFYTWAMVGEKEFLSVLKTMAEEFGNEVVWLESELGE